MQLQTRSAIRKQNTRATYINELSCGGATHPLRKLGPQSGRLVILRGPADPANSVSNPKTRCISIVFPGGSTPCLYFQEVPPPVCISGRFHPPCSISGRFHPLPVFPGGSIPLPVFPGGSIPLPVFPLFFREIPLFFSYFQFPVKK